MFRSMFVYLLPANLRAHKNSNVFIRHQATRKPVNLPISCKVSLSRHINPSMSICSSTKSDSVDSYPLPIITNNKFPIFIVFELQQQITRVTIQVTSNACPMLNFSLTDSLTPLKNDSWYNIGQNILRQRQKIVLFDFPLLTWEHHNF